MEYAGELASAWGGAPRVFRDILKQPIFTATEFFQALASTAQSMASGRSEPYGRANLNGRAPAIHELMSFFPEPETQTLEQYAAQIGRAFPGEEFSIILDRIDIALPEVRTKLTPLLHALFERIGYPVGGIHSCIYAGTYSSTPFGIHIDDCDVLTSSGVGSKKMAFWPREYFEHREEMVMAGSKAHAGVELEALLQEALILEIGPTDLLYWPAGYWHVGVNDTDQFRASLSIGIYHKGSTAGILRKNVPLPFVAPANTNHQALDSLDMQGLHVEKNGDFRPVVPERFGKMWQELREAMNAEHGSEIAFLSSALSMITSAGFGPLPVKPHLPIADKAPIKCISAKSLQCVPIGSSVLVSANGFTFTFHSHADPVITLLQRLKQGEQVCAADMLELVPPDRAGDLWRFMTNGRLVEDVLAV